MTIIANHAHLMPPNDGSGWWPDGDADMLLRHLDFCGIDRVVIFPPFACQMDDSMRKANEWALEQVSRHADRFLPAATLNPIADDAIELLDEMHGHGVRLVKVHPSIDKHDIADPAAAPFYQRAQELQMVVDYHTGPHGTRLSHATPYKFDDLAWDYPGLKLIYEHMGGRPWRELFLAGITNLRGRAFGGVTSVLSLKNNRQWYMGPDKLQEYIELAGDAVFIYGLDFPWNSAEINRQDIDTIQSMNIDAASKDRLLGQTLLMLIQPQS